MILCRSHSLEITITCRFVAYLLYTYACIKHMRTMYILNILQLNGWFINMFIGDARMHVTIPFILFDA